jgi:hypothetical protein
MGGRTLENVGTPAIGTDAINLQYITDRGKHTQDTAVDTGMTWTNGKKIYRWTFRNTTGGSSGNNGSKTIANIPNFDEKVYMDGYVLASDNNQLPLNYYFYDNSFNTTTTVGSSGNVVTVWRTASGNESILANRPVVGTVYYTQK